MGPGCRLPPTPPELLQPQILACAPGADSRFRALGTVPSGGSAPPALSDATDTSALSSPTPPPRGMPPTSSTALGQGDSGCLLAVRECERLLSSTANGARQLEAGETSPAPLELSRLQPPLSPIMSHWRGAVKPNELYTERGEEKLLV